ncbi:hypothetical protein H4S01_006366, partial [Coemansia sp. RSA 2610]
MDNAEPANHGKNSVSRILRKCNDFRSQPAAVLIVSTMAVFSDAVVYGLIVPFLPDVLQDRLGLSSSANGLLFGCFGIGVLIGAPTSAYISDRWKVRKWPMVLGLLGLGATSALFALSNAYWELILARMAQGVSSGITWAIGLAMIADVYQGEALGWAMGIAFSGFTLGYLGGPVFGGAIYSAGGVHAIAIFVGAIAAIDLVFRLLLVEPKDIAVASASCSESLADLVLDNGANEHQLGLDSTLDNRFRKRVASRAAESSPALVATPVAIGSPRSLHGICAASVQELTEIHVADSSSAKKRASSGHADAIAGATASVPALTNATAMHTADAPTVRQDADRAEGAARRTTLWDLLKEWPILACCLAAITTTGTAGAFEPTLPIYMRDTYNSSTIIISVVFIAIVVPNAIIAPIVGKYTSDHRVLARVAPYGRFTFMIGGSVLQAIVTACLGATTSIAGLVVNLVFVGLTGAIASVPIMSTMGEHVGRMGGD